MNRPTLRQIKDLLIDSPAGPGLRAVWRLATRRKADPYDLQTEMIIAGLRPDAICVDVGCHRGSVLKELMKQCPRGRFLAFEPIPHLFDYLNSRFGTDTRVELFPDALSDANGETTFHVYDQDGAPLSGLKTRTFKGETLPSKAISVRTARLDDLRPGLKVDFIKIDVEGAEMLVLRGATETIRRSQPIVVFEHGLGGADFYSTKPEEVFDFFAGVGLSVSLLEDRLANKPSLPREQFVRQFTEHLNYYFVAHPPRS